MKACTDCRWILPHADDPEAAKCGHEAGRREEVSPVTGKLRVGHHSCWLMRSMDSMCGPDGRYFEPAGFG